MSYSKISKLIHDFTSSGNYKVFFSLRTRIVVNLDANYSQELASFFLPLSLKSRILFYFLLFIAKFYVAGKRLRAIPSQRDNNSSNIFSEHTVKCIYTGRLEGDLTPTFLSEYNGQFWVTKIFPESKKQAAFNELLSRDYKHQYSNLLSQSRIDIPDLIFIGCGKYKCVRSVFRLGSSPITKDIDLDIIATYLSNFSKVALSGSTTLSEIMVHQIGLPKYIADEMNAEVLEAEVPLSFQHGDFAPWNVKKCKDGSLILIDWEEAESLPKYFDQIYFDLRRQKVEFNFKDVYSHLKALVPTISSESSAVREALIISYLYFFYRKGYILADDQVNI